MVFYKAQIYFIATNKASEVGTVMLLGTDYVRMLKLTIQVSLISK